MTEREKMLAGTLYDPFDPELVAARERVFFNFNCIVLDVCRVRDHPRRRVHRITRCHRRRQRRHTRRADGVFAAGNRAA